MKSYEIEVRLYAVSATADSPRPTRRRIGTRRIATHALDLEEAEYDHLVATNAARHACGGSHILGG